MSAQVYLLCSAVATTGTQNRVLIEKCQRDEMLLQIDFSSTGSVTIEGRLNSVFPWMTIAGPYTVDTLIAVAYCPELRINIASNAGTVTAGIVTR